jgi:hypothetical protein
MRSSKDNLRDRIISVFVLTSFLFLLFTGTVWAGPRHPGPSPGPPPHPKEPPSKGFIGAPVPWKEKGPPPPGKIWYHHQGDWITLPPPPANGPHIWNGSSWVIDPAAPPPRSEWVPGHWTDDGWIAGHWSGLAEPGPGSVWVEGHWRNGVWVSGHWKGNPPPGKSWVPGHHGPKGHWIPGHYR